MPRGDSDLVECRVCRMNFVTSVPEDVRAHRAEHNELAKGGLPKVVREMLKGFGWAVAHNDGGLQRLRDYEPEDGKLSVAYGWWSRAVLAGVAITEFDDYMAAHLRLIDSIVDNTDAPGTPQRRAVERWEGYAG
ncbi:hypothetical protein OMK73_04010 [Cupriavidus sp. D39]|nr:hypothetical protein [Cupriavidus sp. D39]